VNSGRVSIYIICLVGDFNAETDHFIVLDENDHNKNNISECVENYTGVL